MHDEEFDVGTPVKRTPSPAFACQWGSFEVSLALER